MGSQILSCCGARVKDSIDPDKINKHNKTQVQVQVPVQERTNSGSISTLMTCSSISNVKRNQMKKLNLHEKKFQEEKEDENNIPQQIKRHCSLYTPSSHEVLSNGETTYHKSNHVHVNKVFCENGNTEVLYTSLNHQINKLYRKNKMDNSTSNSAECI